MLDNIKIGIKINKLRLKNNFSQDQLAELILVSRQAISKWEVGQTLPSIDNLVSLVEIFKVPLEELLCLDDEVFIDEKDIFKNHQRSYIVNKACRNELNLNLAIVFEQFNQNERMLILYHFKANKIALENDLLNKLTLIERKMMEEKV